MSCLYDISSVLSHRLATWPGDAGFEREVRASHGAGDRVEVSRLLTTAHAGTHADAPIHIVAGAPALDAVDLAPYWGRCQVIQVALPPRARILPKDVLVSLEAPRVLFRTDSYPDPEHFVESFNALSPELITWLQAEGVVLVGLDTPSVDPFDSTDLESHRALFGCGMRCLEGLVLAHVPTGVYELSALPLKVEGGDGSPVRAALRAL